MDNKKQLIYYKLLEYQQEHVNNIIRILTNNNSCLDASDTGTGKTYSAIAACILLNIRPIIICPKSVIATWKSVSNYFKLLNPIIVNYETIKKSKIYKDTDKKIKADFIKIVRNDKNIIEKIEFDFTKSKIIKNDENILFIFDEVHRCSNLESDNCMLLLAAKETQKKILLLSATIADFPEKFKPFFYILNFINPEQVKEKNIDYKKYIKIVESWIMRDYKPMVRIYNMLYPDRATRVRIDVLGDMFPDTQITATPYTLSKKRAEEIEREYKKLALELDKIKNKKNNDKINPLTLTIRAHQKIEILKIPTFVELAHDFIQNKYSVVIFVNFTQTLKTLAEMLHTDSIVYGEQDYNDRLKVIEDFQANKTNIIILNIKAGGVGISLHDIYGGHPRISLISPTWSSLDLVQALGRIHRAGGKTKSLQRIIYTANTVEEKISEKIKLKLKNINSINNGDLDLTNINFENKYNLI
jgi:superfamily II DNA or RNA helicase